MQLYLSSENQNFSSRRDLMVKCC